MYGRKTHRLNLVFVLFFTLIGRAQETNVNQNTADSSYAYYVQKDWKQLILNGKSVVEEGGNYYYLRLRIGIAHYELKEYFLAEQHFKAAIEFNDLEDLPKEYLYYCYFFTDRIEQSRRVANQFGAEFNKKIGLDTVPLINYFGVDGGGKFSNLADVPNAGLMGFNVGHRLSSSIFIDHNYSFYTQQNDLWQFKQHDYLIQATIPLKKNHTVAASFHYVNSNTAISAPLFSLDSSGAVFVGSINVQKQFKNHRIDLGTSALGMGTNLQLQYNLGYAFYPRSNNSFSLGAKGYVHTNDGHGSTYFAVLPFLSFRPQPKLDFFASYLLNQGNNIAEWNGALVNNSPDLTTGRFSLTAGYWLTTKAKISLTYQNEQKESGWTADHNYNSLFVSLKFIP